jgi:hypothetical protein
MMGRRTKYACIDSSCIKYFNKQKKLMGLFDFLKPQSPQQKRQEEMMQAIGAAAAQVIPGGKADVEAWGRRVHDAADGRLSTEESQFIFGAVTCLFALPGDKGEDRMVESILSRAGGKISRDQARSIFTVLCAYQRARQLRLAGVRPPET